MPNQYTALELKLFAFALGLSFLLILFGETREMCGLPPFLAWLMINRRQH